MNGPREHHVGPLDAVPVRVGRGRDRASRGIAAAWVMGLGAIVGLGLVTKDVTRPPDGDARAAEASAVPFSPPVPDRTAEISLTEPAPEAPIAARRIHVEGYVDGAGGPVWVGLMGRGERLLSSRTLGLSRWWGDARSARLGWFDTELTLPDPHPNGVMSILVIAYDRPNVPIAAARRVIRFLAAEPMSQGSMRASTAIARTNERT